MVPDLDQTACEDFRRDGYVAGIDLLDADEVEQLRERLESIGSRITELEDQLYEVETAWLERPDETVLHFLGAWRLDQVFRDLVFRPGITVPCAQLLGVERLRFWHDQVFWKPPRHPGVVPWHQDYSYWARTGPPAHITMFITLDDMSAANGGLEYIPGSHRLGLLPAADFGGEMDALLDHLPAEQRDRFRPVPVQLKAGQASIHHSHLIHGSRGNRSDRPRRAIVLNYMADGTRVIDGSAPLLKGVPPIAAGQLLSGEFFPLVLPYDGSPAGYG